jgi:hypothetical protein
MSDWREKLAGLHTELRGQEQKVADVKTAVLTGFRKLLKELEPVMETAAQFGDAFGVECDYEISRFDDRYPWLRFRIKKPVLLYEVICKEGVLHERLKEGEATKTSTTTLEKLAPKAFEQRITAWVQAGAQANRKVPGKR